MTANQDIGKNGEGQAKQYLLDHGFKVLHENWRKGQLEVDLIAEKDQMLIFIEVKTRAANFLVSPSAAVNKTKQQALIRAAKFYMEYAKSEQEIRFDIISVIHMGTTYTIDHIPDAFRSYLKR